jgi:tRNA modification GTPase
VTVANPYATIFALATPPGRGGIAIIRISGPDAGAAARTVSGRPLPPPRQAARARFADPATREPIDDGLVVLFPKPNSYTGEDVVELHLHAGPAVVAGLVAALRRIPGLRAAEPGEFTRRAFENGKLDLTEAEAVADLVAAETEAQRRQALRQLDGELGAVYEGWRADLVGLLARLEAHIDFPDEDLPAEIVSGIKREGGRVAGAMRAHLADGRRGERLRDGVHVAIVGAPNAGKSSLLNRLARREAAIVSATAGTTRDVIEVHLDLGGYPAIFADTAGLRDSADELEREGVRRALARATAADLKIAVFDATRAPDAPTAALVDGETLVVLNKIDLAAGPRPSAIAGQVPRPVSALTGQGLPALLSDIETMLRDRLAPAAGPSLTRARHRAAVEDCVRALERLVAGAGAMAEAPELVAEDLRLAARALGRITGRVDVEDVLDSLFRDFCIGK